MLCLCPPLRTLPLCCLRLLFFPLVIAWDTYSEACRNLQDKYDAWQQGAQVGSMTHCSASWGLVVPVAGACSFLPPQQQGAQVAAQLQCSAARGCCVAVLLDRGGAQRGRHGLRKGHMLRAAAPAARTAASSASRAWHCCCCCCAARAGGCC